MVRGAVVRGKFAMTFEFLIACRMASEADAYVMLQGILSEALLNSQDELDEEAVGQMIRIRHQRSGDEVVDGDGETARHKVWGFTVELPETESAEAIVDDFASSSSGSSSIFHSLRFEDPLLQDELVHRSAEIFALEMKLRRVLSFIYLHAYQCQDPYDLLREEKMEPVTPNLKANDMESVAENSSGPHHQDSGEAKIRESTAGVSRKPSSDGKTRGCSSKHLWGLTAWNT